MRGSVDSDARPTVLHIVQWVRCKNRRYRSIVSAKMSGTAENIKVAVRVRPLTVSELSDKKLQKCVSVNKKTRQICLTKSVSTTASSTNSGPYTFDYVFDENDSQIEVYSQVVSSIVDDVFSGFNGAILAYGQTGSGKTFTITGKRSPAELRGMLPLTFEHIFAKIAESKGAFLVNVTYLEIYNDEVYDLLVRNDSKLQTGALEIRERPGIGVFVDKLSGYIVQSLDDVDKLLQIGNKNRVTASTQMNAESSRSHSIFTITLESVSEAKQDHKFGKLTFVDLAGSERQKKSNTTGIRFKEATKINVALSVLSNVISILSEGKNSFVPYRSSKLTRLLQDSLGGNSKTAMIATISPSEFNVNETCSTLRYASRTKFIRNCVYKNETQKESLLKQFQDEIIDLKKQLESLNDSAIVADGSRGSRGDDVDEADDDAIEDINSTDSYGPNDFKRKRFNQNRLNDQLTKLTNKVLIGGENLLEKVKIQKNLLNETTAEIKDIERNEQKLEQSLRQKEIERLTIEQTCSSLLEDLAVKRDKFRSIMKLTQLALIEYDRTDARNRSELDDLRENVAFLNEAADELLVHLLEKHIPGNYLQLILSQCCEYDRDSNEWKIVAAESSGNSLEKLTRNYYDWTRNGFVEAARPTEANSSVYESYFRLNGSPKTAPLNEHVSFIPKRKF